MCRDLLETSSHRAAQKVQSYVVAWMELSFISPHGYMLCRQQSLLIARHVTEQLFIRFFNEAPVPKQKRPSKGTMIVPCEGLFCFSPDGFAEDTYTTVVLWKDSPIQVATRPFSFLERVWAEVSRKCGYEASRAIFVCLWRPCGRVIDKAKPSVRGDIKLRVSCARGVSSRRLDSEVNPFSDENE